MRRAGKRQVDVAQALGLTQSAVSARLSDQIPWRLRELQQIATLLGVPVAELVADEPADDAAAVTR